MNTNQKLWNLNQQKLRLALAAGYHQKAIDLFLSQHAMLHSAKIARTRLWSYEDEIFEDAAESTLRTIPRNGEHSIAWIIWHLARIEDVTMNILVAGSPQVFDAEDWGRRMKVRIRHTGNAMEEDAVASFSKRVDLDELRAYRLAVGRRTRSIVKRLKPHQLERKVQQKRIEQILIERGVLEEAMEIVVYWSRRTIAGLLLMPPTRHNFLHLNEALRIKQKLQLLTKRKLHRAGRRLSRNSLRSRKYMTQDKPLELILTGIVWSIVFFLLLALYWN